MHSSSGSPRAWLSGRFVLVPAIAILLGTSALPFPAAPGAADTPAPTAWVDDMRNALGRYMWTHPASPLSPYLDTLTLVRDAVGREDRGMVKREMETYFGMLAIRAQGITEPEAKALSAVALRMTPVQAYGISIPAALGR
jgi:hypothetical protein